MTEELSIVIDYGSVSFEVHHPPSLANILLRLPDLLPENVALDHRISPSVLELTHHLAHMLVRDISRDVLREHIRRNRRALDLVGPYYLLELLRLGATTRELQGGALPQCPVSDVRPEQLGRQHGDVSWWSAGSCPLWQRLQVLP